MPALALEDYARARVAESNGSVAAAVNAYRQALASDPQSQAIALRSYRQGIEAGDLALALQSARILDGAGALPSDGTLLLLSDALARSDWDAADALNLRLSREMNFSFLSPIIADWIALGERKPVVAVETPSALRGLTGRYLSEHLALQALVRRDVDGALPLIDAAFAGQDDGLPTLRIAAAAALVMQGRKDEALGLLPADKRLYATARAAIIAGKGRKQGKMLAITTPAQGFARLMTRLAGDVAGGNGKMLALRVARIASFADPRGEAARIGVADALEANDQPDLALTELAAIPAGSWYGPVADPVRLDALIGAKQMDAALSEAQAQMASPGAGTPEVLRLAEVLGRRDDHAAAAQTYREATARFPAGQAPWTLYLLEGAALDQGGQWRQAIGALETAVSLAPDEPSALNYLGYIQVENGVNVPAALAMLKKANALRPNDAAITDSLGWAHYIAGDARTAVPVLERAAAAAADNGTIHEHLGDALWAVGRRFEARYAWRAAALLADTDDAGRIATKLRDGLQVSAAKR